MYAIRYLKNFQRNPVVFVIHRRHLVLSSKAEYEKLIRISDSFSVLASIDRCLLVYCYTAASRIAGFGHIFVKCSPPQGRHCMPTNAVYAICLLIWHLVLGSNATSCLHLPLVHIESWLQYEPVDCKSVHVTCCWDCPNSSQSIYMHYRESRETLIHFVKILGAKANLNGKILNWYVTSLIWIWRNHLFSYSCHHTNLWLQTHHGNPPC